MSARWFDHPDRNPPRRAAMRARQRFASRPYHRTYFAYVEEAVMLSGRMIDGPDAAPLSLDQPLVAPRRFRFAGIEVASFDRLFGGFTLVDPAAVEPADRGRRLEAWRALPEKPRIPLIDLLVAEHRLLARQLSDLLVPGEWFQLLIAPPYRQDRPIVYLGAPELPGEVERSSLRSIRKVSPQDRRRLTDIFSLVHVNDAELGPEQEGGADPTRPGGEGGGGDPGGAAPNSDAPIEAEMLAEEGSDWLGDDGTAETFARAEASFSSDPQRSLTVKQADEPVVIHLQSGF